MSGAPHREPLVGRGRELEVARQLLQAAVDGRPQLLTLSGEVGIGKSRLARAIAAEASRHGALTLWGAGQEDLSLPYLPVSMALAPLSVDGPGLLDPGSQGAGADADPVRMWGNVTQAVLAAASQRPVVLVMDDLQWTDGASQALLLHLLVVLDHAATSAPVRLLTVITVRTPHDEERTTRMLSRVVPRGAGHVGGEPDLPPSVAHADHRRERDGRVEVPHPWPCLRQRRPGRRGRPT